MLKRFRARKIMATHSEFEKSIDHFFKYCWGDVKKDAKGADIKGYMVVFCFCVHNSFEVLRTFSAREPKVARALQEGGMDIVAIELALLGIARASQDEALKGDFDEVIKCGHKVLTMVAGEPFKTMEYKDFFNHYSPLANLDEQQAISVTATRIVKRLGRLPELLAGVLASSLAMTAASETYAEGALTKVRKPLEQS